MTFGVSCKQAQLADKIFDIMHDERHPAVEFVKSLRFGERFLTARFGQITGDLPPDYAQHIQIFPVQCAVDPRSRQQHQSDKAIEMN